MKHRLRAEMAAHLPPAQHKLVREEGEPMILEEQRVPSLPGAEDVTDGSVDYYGTDWTNVDNGATEEQMQKCMATPCSAENSCSGNQPEQTDESSYQIVSE